MSKCKSRVQWGDIVFLFCENGGEEWCRLNGISIEKLRSEGIPFEDIPDTLHSRMAMRFVSLGRPYGDPNWARKKRLRHFIRLEADG